MRQGVFPWLAASVALSAAVPPAHAQPAPGAPPAAGAPMGAAPPGFLKPASNDPAAAPQGAYMIDLEHCAVVARVKHAGTSFSVLRFGVTKGSLIWDAKHPAGIKLDVTVDAKPHYDPIVYKFTPDSPPMLNVAQFPQANFVSKSVRLKGPRAADIEGELTLMGTTRPVVIHAELVGVGKAMSGAATVGFTGTMAIRWGDFKKAGGGPDFGEITLVLDADFIKA